MGLDLDYADGQTPIDEDEREGLLIKTISTLAELNEFEQLNVEKAVEWTMKSNLTTDKILTEKFVLDLHKRMFGDVWKWAGSFRTSDKNIGVDKYQIGIELKNLFDDCKYWIEQKLFPEDEIAVRFSHRIVVIHPFPNGNGRHSRLLGDILISNVLGKPHFTWGSTDLLKPGEARKEYLEALRAADNQEYEPLIEFARK
jgi:Fic-DOC domain mobile mystery protein B